jgi:hypothetical protein
MIHTREGVIERTICEYEFLDQLLESLSEEDWEQPLIRAETKDPWTVMDAVAHIVHWKADTARSARKQRRPPEERGLSTHEANHLIYVRWHDRTLEEIKAWHREVQEDVLAALREVPEEWFSGRDRTEKWPYDLDGHSKFHRVRDIERALYQ